MAVFKKGNISLHLDDVFSFLKNIKDNSIDLIITDPAYSGMNKHLKLGKGRIVGDYKNNETNEKWFKEFEDSAENYEVFLNECKRIMKDQSHIFIMFDSYSLISLSPIFREIFDLKNIITWDKVNIGMGHYFRRRSEFILFGSKGKKNLSARNIPDIWRIKRLHAARYPTEKPVELFEAMIKSSQAENKNLMVCDPFYGSGSSAIAAMRNNCSFIGTDISEKAFSIAKERVKNFKNEAAKQEIITSSFWER